jgi:tetratricopeptide (TPR) repeat protein
MYAKSILICLIIFQGLLFADTPEELFEKGNQYYRNNEFEEAIEIYEDLITDGYEGVELYYNLGNSYYKLNKFGLAILNYERALKLSPGDEDIQHNLALTNTKTIDNIETLPGFFLFDWWNSLLKLFSISGWTNTTYIVYLVLLVLIGFYFFVRNPVQKKLLLIAGLVTAFLFSISSIFLIVNLNEELNIKNGVVVEAAVNVKLSPDGDDAFIIHEGIKVNIEDKVDDWVKIRLQDGKIGWMLQDDLRII